MTRWTNGWVAILVLVLVAGVLAGCGRDDHGALLVRWPF